jgi:Transglycosylase SLT domain
MPLGATASVGAVLGLGWVTIAGIAAIAGGGASVVASSPGQAPSATVADIPPSYLALYRAAGQRYGIDWAVLAGIGKVECDHGRDPDPSCTTEGAVNAAGAGGPMQFLGETWARYGVDGDGDGRRDRWDPADAVFAAANYLRAAGAPSDYRGAIYSYNHAWWYVADVLRRASVYRTAGAALQAPVSEQGTDAALQARTATPVRLIAGATARLSPGDGHLALIPALAPPAVQAMLIAGNELQDLPYGPAGHPDPRGAKQEDCSSTLNFLLYRAGLRPITEILDKNPVAQDYVDWGLPGPGRWVTIYATASPTPHVFAVIAGLRIDTSHTGTDVGPNGDQNGPRWRIFDTIPGWAHWSVRHPPGL